MGNLQHCNVWLHFVSNLQKWQSFIFFKEKLSTLIKIKYFFINSEPQRFKCIYSSIALNIVLSYYIQTLKIRILNTFFVYMYSLQLLLSWSNSVQLIGWILHGRQCYAALQWKPATTVRQILARQIDQKQHCLLYTLTLPTKRIV